MNNSIISVQNQKIFNMRLLKLPLIFAAVLALLSGCGNGTTTTSTTTTATATAATLQLSATKTTVPADNSTNTTITVTALDSGNAALSGITVNLSADTGIVSTPTVTTGTGGTATFTFSSGTASLANRTATITADAGATATTQILISGYSTSFSSVTQSSIPNDGTTTTTVTYVVQDANGNAVSGVSCSAASASTTTTQATVTTSPATCVTDANGKFQVIVTAVASTPAGSVTISGTAAGSTATTTINITASATTFGITQANVSGAITTNPTSVAMYTTDTLTLTVSDPAPATSVDFITTQGAWSGTGCTISGFQATCTVSGGSASATLSAVPAGVTNIQVQDSTSPTTLNATLPVSVTAQTPYKVTLQASPTVVAKTTGSTTGTSTLLATVTDNNGAPVGNAAVAFSLSNTTGGGEFISPVVAYTTSSTGGTLALGEATATFTSGSLSSSGTGVQVRATVISPTTTPAVVTGTSPSGNDASIVIGGTAGSIAFGRATKINVVSTTTYSLPMSVLVSDVNGNAMANTTVYLKAWPTAWSTGTACAYDADDGATLGTFDNEDFNQDLTLSNPGLQCGGASEDGCRLYYSGMLFGGTSTYAIGTPDGALTPPNSAAGSLPASVVTDSTGVANFDLTYLKTSAIWTVDTITASTIVQGTETISSTTFRLPAAAADTSPCVLGNGGDSPYNF